MVKDNIIDILSQLTFAPSGINFDWKWEVKETDGGFLIRTTFLRPDTNTGEMGTGYGRYMFLHEGIDERGVVMTAWICAKLIVEHELMESFVYKGVKILDPHKSLEELSYRK